MAGLMFELSRGKGLMIPSFCALSSPRVDPLLRASITEVWYHELLETLTTLN